MFQFTFSVEWNETTFSLSFELHFAYICCVLRSSQFKLCRVREYLFFRTLKWHFWGGINMFMLLNSSVHIFTIMNIVCNKWTTINPRMLHRNIHLNDIGLWSIRTFGQIYECSNLCVACWTAFDIYMNANIYSQILHNNFLLIHWTIWSTAKPLQLWAFISK